VYLDSGEITKKIAKPLEQQIKNNCGTTILPRTVNNTD
jgi:hypothetical protein